MVDQSQGASEERIVSQAKPKAKKKEVNEKQLRENIAEVVAVLSKVHTKVRTEYDLLLRMQNLIGEHGHAMKDEDIAEEADRLMSVYSDIHKILDL